MDEWLHYGPKLRSIPKNSLEILLCLLAHEGSGKPRKLNLLRSLGSHSIVCQFLKNSILTSKSKDEFEDMNLMNQMFISEPI